MNEGRFPVKTLKTTKLGLGLAALGGLLLLAGLIAYNGFVDVARAFLAVGWVGILAVSLYHVVPVIFTALGWRSLSTRYFGGSPLLFIWMRLVREAVSNLLPVAQIGGEVVGARMLTLRGLRNGMAGASVVVDLTIEAMTLFFFTLLGLGLLALGRHDFDAVSGVVVGLGFAAPIIAAFFAAQHWGLFKLLEDWLERRAEKWGWVREMCIAGLHNSIKAIYRDRRALINGSCFHFLSWVFGSGEIWIALHFMGHGISLGQALIIESLSQAVRGVGFAIPGALGVQEGGFLLVGGLMGLGPDVSLALSLVRRMRDLVLGVPSLAVWHFIEGRRLWLRVQHQARQADRN